MERRWSTAGGSPARELVSFRLITIEAVVEVTKPLKPLVDRVSNVHEPRSHHSQVRRVPDSSFRVTPEDGRALGHTLALAPILDLIVDLPV